uniref:Uncharacterized protein n=1 Tax=Panagrolaimus sp. ES5 TaxID=591445 RepID=A0AC34GNU4_9BILA
MAVGCYVIGEDVIHLSIPTLPSPYYASEGVISYFVNACKKLTQKLECLVIVDPEFTEPKILKELFNIGQEYANFVYIIPAIVALLQYTVSSVKHFLIDNILILLKVAKYYYVCRLIKENNVILPSSMEKETPESLHNYIAAFQDVHCIYPNGIKENVRRILKSQFPTINYLRLYSPMITLASGGFYKAQCIVEPGKHLEVANIAPGIYNGNNVIVNRCATFPLQIQYVPVTGVPTSLHAILTVRSMVREKLWRIRELEIILPPQNCLKRYIIEYNEFGLLTIKEPDSQLSFNIFNDFLFNLNKVQVWFMEKQTRAIFDISQKERTFVSFNDNVKKLLSDEWLNTVDQNKEFPTTSTSDLHTVFVDKNVYNYINGPKISIAPSYIGILQYFVTYSKPTTLNLIILVITKSNSKFYALTQRSPLCYTVTYMADYSETQTLLFDADSVKKKIRILYIHEKGMSNTLSLNFFSTNISVTRFELSNFEEVTFYGGAIYALQNFCTTLTSPYVTIDPSFNPEENNCDDLATVSQRRCFYEIEAVFNGALKSINQQLFYGDLIAIILKRKENVYIYFFCHVKKKFLFKFDIIASSSEIIDASTLHFADCIIVFDSDDSKWLKFGEGLSVKFFKWDKCAGVNEFLKDMNEEKLLIYDSFNYFEAITRAQNYGILESIIFEKTLMTIEYVSDKCRIIVGNDDDQYIAVDGEERIPMYISFFQKLPIFGNDALKDLDTSPESVIFDFVKLIGATSKSLPLINPKWKFELVEMDNSDDPKIGFKIKTNQGFKIITPEMAVTIFLQKLIAIYEKHAGKSVDEIQFRLLNDTVLTETQKEAFKNAAKRLKKFLVFC